MPFSSTAFRHLLTKLKILVLLTLLSTTTLILVVMGIDPHAEWYGNDGRNVVVHMSDTSVKSGRADQQALKVLSFCVNCPDPSSEGSIVSGLLNYHNLFPIEDKLEYDMVSELVWCIPNYADHKKILNAEQMKNRIVMVKRGRNSLFEKVDRITTLSEAAAVVVVDDGQCDEAFRWCGARAGSVQTQGFSAYDDEVTWGALSVPVVMVTATTGKRFSQMMTTKKVDVLGFPDPQLMTILDLRTASTKTSASFAEPSSSSSSSSSSSFDPAAADDYDYYYEDEL